MIRLRYAVVSVPSLTLCKGFSKRVPVISTLHTIRHLVPRPLTDGRR